MKKTLSVLLALTLALMLALPVCGADFPAASGGVSGHSRKRLPYQPMSA